MSLMKYTDTDVIAEAEMVLRGQTLYDVSHALGIPKSTVSWHLIPPLERIDFDLYVQVRERLNKYAKNQKRQSRDKALIYLHNEGIITGRRKHNESKNNT